jgi:hypothetical protein
MLDHGNIAIKIYGIRGIGSLRAMEYRERLQNLTEEGMHPGVRSSAELALRLLDDENTEITADETPDD